MAMAADLRGVVVMFGGQNASGGPLGDTWTYDTGTGAWVRVQSTASPLPRVYSAMTYDSSAGRFILFGGTNFSAVLNDTWEFDLENSAWTQLAPSKSPTTLLVSAFCHDPSEGVSVLYGGLAAWIGDPRNETWVFDHAANRWKDATAWPNPGMYGGVACGYSTSARRIVYFGGNDYGGGGATNGTWAYDTANGTWRQFSFATGPRALEGPSMIGDPATGDLVVFGGWNGGFWDETWVFDPVQVAWAQVKGYYTPPRRGYAGMAHDPEAGTTVLFGGHDFGGPGIMGDLWHLDAASMAWRKAPIAPPPEAIHGTSLVYSPATGRIYRFFAGPTQNETLVIDPSGGTVQAVNATNMPASRRYHVAVSIDDEAKILVFGDISVSDGRTWLYDPVANTWSSSLPAGSPQPRQLAAAAYDPVNRKVVMFGGANAGAVMLRETWVYDVANGTWSNPAPAIQPRGAISAAMTFDPVSRRTLLFGGNAVLSQDAIGELWAYDAKDNVWTNLTDIRTPTGRGTAGMTFDPRSGQVYVFGGYRRAPCGATDFRDTLAYDVRSGDWSFLTPASSPAPRCLSSIVRDPASGRMWMVGGLNPASRELWVYDPLSNEWAQAGPKVLPPGRYNFGFGYDPVGRRMLVFSGWTSADDTWELDISTDTWRNVNTAVKPPARGGSRLAYDSWHQRFVMFSGSNGAADTWTYDPATEAWTLMSTGAGPAPDAIHGIAFDESVGRTVLRKTNGETWTYDLGTNSWQRMRPVASPSARGFSDMVYVPSIRKTLLFGGSSGGGFVNDTWLYDARADNWTQVAKTGVVPPISAAHGLVYDGSTGKVIMWSGYTGGATHVGTTWMFDPETLTWARVPTRNSPLGREGQAMVYDPESRRIAMFAGIDLLNFVPRNDTWYLDYSLAPNVAMVSPADGSTGVAQDASVKVRFDMDMDPKTTVGAFSISPAVAGTAAVTGRELEFTHARFARGTVYTVTIGASASNLGGDTMAAPRTFSFTTLAPPRVVLTDPVNNATGVALDQIVGVQFNEAMNVSATIAASSISPSVNGAFLFLGARTLAFGHVEPFAPMTTYTLTVAASAQSATGDNLAADFVLRFTTGPAAPPRVVSASPPDGSTMVNDSAPATVTFSEPMNRSATQAAVSSSPAAAWNPSWSQGDRVLTLTPASPLAAGTKHTLTVGTGAKSQLGANLSAAFSWSYTVSPWVPPPPPPPPTVPRVVSASPPNGEKYVNDSARIVLAFSEPMNKDSVEKALNTSPSGVSYTFAWNTAADLVTLTPTAKLRAGTEYKITLGTTAASALNVTLKEVFVTSFTVSPWTPPPTPPPPPGADFGMLGGGLILGLIIGLIVGMVLFKRRSPAAGTVVVKGTNVDQNEKSGADKVGNDKPEAGEVEASKGEEAEGPADEKAKGIVKGIGGGGAGTGTPPASPPPPPPPPPGKSDKPLPYIPPPDSKK
jgi:hypothetical protein